MKKTGWLSLITLVAALSGCGLFFKTVAGSTATVTLDPTVAPFTRVALDQACQAEVSYGADCAVSVTINENLQDYLQITEEAGRLTVTLDPSVTYRNLVFTARITLPVLDTLSVDDAARAAVSGFSGAAAMEISASDAARVSLNGIDAADLVISARDASAVTGSLSCESLSLSLVSATTASLSGTAETLTLSGDNACEAELGSLQTADMGVSLSNASEARVRVTGQLSGSVTNASRLRYTGGPASVGVSVTNASTIQSY